MAVAGGGQPPFLSPQSVPNSLKSRQIGKRKKERVSNKIKLWNYKLFASFFEEHVEFKFSNV